MHKVGQVFLKPFLRCLPLISTRVEDAFNYLEVVSVLKDTRQVFNLSPGEKKALET
jgi:hypothetical protein